MFNKRINLSTLPLVLILFTIGLLTLYSFARYASHTPFWQDETLIVFVANHSPFSIHFYQALKSMTSAMPWPFVEYWAYLQLLKLVPFNHLMEHLDLYLRIPLFIYLSLSMIFTFLMVHRLSKSLILAAFTTVTLFITNDLTQILGLELRFHTSTIAHTAISWCLLSYVLTYPKKEKPRKSQYFVYGLWIISALTTGWSHIFGTYNLILQILIFSVSEFNLLPEFRLNWLNRRTKIATFCLLSFFAALQSYFYMEFMQKASSRGISTEPWNANLWRATNLISQQIFSPWIGIWIISFLIFGIIAIKKTIGLDRFKISGMALFGLGNLLCILTLGFLFLRISWYTPLKMARYVMPGLIPFVFSWAYLAGYAMKKKWDQKFGVYVAVGLIILTLNLWPFPKVPPSDLPFWNITTTMIQKENAFGKVTHVAGLQPRHDHSLQEDIHGAIFAHTWQLYTGGPFKISPIQTYKTNAYGGRVNVPCEQVSNYPVANQDNANNYLIDFCTFHQPVLRVFAL